MAWIKLTLKRGGATELVNTDTISRISRHEDADPETVLIFATGRVVAYRETVDEMWEAVREGAK